MNIGGYISKLLYNHNYVVIPNFGGFVCHEFGAKINEATQMFMPPTKRVSFQSALQESSFVLENLISKEEQISISEAKSQLNNLVNDWKLKLAEGSHIKLDGVGRIYLNNNNEVAFQSELNANFDAASFGLGIFRFPVLKDETVSAPISTSTVLASVKSQKVSKIWQRAAMVAGIVGLIFIGSQKADFNSFNIASFNPLKFSKSVTTEKVEKTSVKAVVTKEAVELKTVDFGEINTEVKTLPELLTKDEAANYHVIVGAFKVQNNASAFLNKLRAKGFDNAQYFYEKGFYRVSADHYTSRSMARKSLVEIKGKIQKGAWIYSR